MTSAVPDPVTLCNLALSQIGSRAQVTSINPSDGTAAGDACSLLYQPTVDAFARAAHWNCLRFTTGTKAGQPPAPLTLLKAAAGTPENVNGSTLPVPPIRWLYEYELPSDCLKARFLVPQITQQALNPPLTTGTTTFLPASVGNCAIPFVVAADLDQSGNEIQVLLTNIGTFLAGPPALVYTKRLQNIGLWDSQFLMGAKSALAAWLVNPLNCSSAMMQQAMGIAKVMLDAARISDGNEGPTTSDHEATWITARYGGRLRPHGLYIAPYDAFGFPDG